MIPKKPAPDLIDLIRGGNRFSEKHALGLDPGDHAQNKKLEPGSDSIRIDGALANTKGGVCPFEGCEHIAAGVQKRAHARGR